MYKVSILMNPEVCPSIKGEDGTPHYLAAEFDVDETGGREKDCTDVLSRQYERSILLFRYIPWLFFAGVADRSSRWNYLRSI